MRWGRRRDGFAVGAVALIGLVLASRQVLAERVCPSDFGPEQVQHCAWGGFEDEALRAELVLLLLRTGYFRPAEFGGVRIAWCGLPWGIYGTAANAGQVYLNSATHGLARHHAAALLAHEMVHVRQYRRLGEAGFRAAYGTAKARCGCCRGAGHWMEREAFAVEAAVRRALGGRRR